jgi:hypothetical protein
MGSMMLDNPFGLIKNFFLIFRRKLQRLKYFYFNVILESPMLQLANLDLDIRYRYVYIEKFL